MLASGYKDDNAIMNIGQANDLFSSIPSGFFWVYLYTSSPYGTLAAQQGFDNTNRSDFETFIEGAVLPDFVSKYIAPTVSTIFQPLRLTPELTVGTGFSVALVTLGFTGVILLFLWIIFISFSFAWLNRNRYIKSTCAILSAAAILMTFDNMFIFSSCVMQLIIITLFSRFRFSKYFLI
ncbi:hypothetical protein ABK905_17845 [Acerihabitans sp. KWT182]|uniref:Uncharacterized protein n=1 Tax=Acerihabitans sp. KWT182 TaxID=3157919 RepID=A0AAU7Q660_9GAMM